MAEISLDNGRSFLTAEEAIASGVSWDLVFSFMDDEIREQVHAELAPCSEEEFLRRYLELSPENLIIG